MADSSHLIRRELDAGPWTVVCDFDGTISDFDVTDDLLARFALPEWEQVEVEWKAGRISARECMARQVALLRVSRAALAAHLDTIAIDPTFHGFVDECRQRHLPLRVVSDGLDFSIERILRRHNLGRLPVLANHLVCTGPTTWALEFPNGRNGCRAGSGTCKCAIAAAPRRRVLLIGDGRSDFCLARSADFVFAKNRLTDYCVSQNIPHRAFERFADLRCLLSELLDHPHHHYQPQPLPWEELTDGRSLAVAR